MSRTLNEYSIRSESANDEENGEAGGEEENNDEATTSKKSFSPPMTRKRGNINILNP